MDLFYYTFERVQPSIEIRRYSEENMGQRNHIIDIDGIRYGWSISGAHWHLDFCTIVPML